LNSRPSWFDPLPASFAQLASRKPALNPDIDISPRRAPNASNTLMLPLTNEALKLAPLRSELRIQPVNAP
jgi:hypothetical protein